MRSLTRLNIVIGILSIIMVITGAFLLNKRDAGYFILYGGFLLATIFSIVSIIDVFKTRSITPARKIVWLIMVICVPVFGGLLYYGIQLGKNSSDVISTPDSEGNF